MVHACVLFFGMRLTWTLPSIDSAIAVLTLQIPVKWTIGVDSHSTNTRPGT